MKKLIWLILVVLISSAITTGCKKKDKGNPPELPPTESMVMDFSNFVNGTKSAKGVLNSTWEFASLYAGYWSTLITTTLAVPTTAFEQAHQNSPSFIDENFWQWSFNTTVTVNNVNTIYKARLTGQKTATEVQWKMYITKEGSGAFSEFLWFEGTSEPDGTAGQWTINHSSRYQEQVLLINWTRSGNEVNSAKYLYTRERNDTRQTDPLKGSYIEYGNTSDPLDSFFSIHYFNGVSFMDLRIEWSQASKLGRVNSPGYFGNNNWYCWNTNYENIVCPQ